MPHATVVARGRLARAGRSAWWGARLLAVAALVTTVACSGDASFPVTPTPVASSPVVLQGSTYQGAIVLASGAATTFNMTLIARSLANQTTVSGNFQTGSGLTGTVDGILTGTLASGTFDGTLTATSSGRVEERRYAGVVTSTAVAWVPGDCVQSCAADGLTFTVEVSTPAAPACVFSVAPGATSFGASGGDSAVSVTASSGCAWASSSSVPWMQILGATVGTGNGMVSFRVQANTGAARQGVLRVAGHDVTVTQQDSVSTACRYSLSPVTQSAPASGASFNAELTIGAGCSGTWTASTDSPSWISGMTPATGAGSATIRYTVAANAGEARTGRLLVTGPGGTAQVSVAQVAASPSIVVTPSSVSLTSAARTGLTSTVTANVSWTAVSDAAWLTVTAGGSGSSGTSTLTFAAAANPGATGRTGVISLSGGSAPTATVSVVQAGAGPTIVANPPAVSVSSGAQSGAVSITANVNWVAASDQTWVTVTGGTPGSGDGRITYSVAANPGPVRTATITVAGGGANTIHQITQAAIPVTTITFDAVSVPAGTCTDASAYLASFGIGFAPITGGPSPVLCNSTGTSATASSPPNVFYAIPATTNTDESYELVFQTPLAQLRFTRATVPAVNTLPAWNARAFSAAGVQLSAVGEAAGFGTPATTFTLAGPGITRVRIESFNSTARTFNHPPFDDFVLTAMGLRAGGQDAGLIPDAAARLGSSPGGSERWARRTSLVRRRDGQKE